MEELQRFYFTPALEEALGIPPTAKSTPPKIEGFSLPGQGEPYDTCGEEGHFMCPGVWPCQTRRDELQACD
ncbi:unnamed protein product, partial [marine sediment metagenome]